MDDSTLAALGLRGTIVRKLSGGFTNEHWLCIGDEAFVVRRSRESATLDGVVYEGDVVNEMARRGWPVPVPLTEPIELDGRVHCAFNHLDGRSPERRTPEGDRALGHLLAELHADLSDLPHIGYREGWYRSESSFEGVESLAVTHPQADVIVTYAERTRDWLDRLDASAQPTIVVHGDIMPGNVLYEGSKLTGVLDWDLTHRNHRVTDFALSWRGRHDGIVLAYDEVSPLSEREWELLTPVYWAFLLMCARHDLEQHGSDANLDWVLNHLHRRGPLMRL